MNLCRLVGVSRQSYYRSTWRKRDRQKMVEEVTGCVRAVRKQMPRIGTRKLYHLLKPDLRHMHVGRDKLFTIFRANDMLIPPKRSYRTTTNSHHRFHKHNGFY
jgi:hypothetical protein